MAEWFFYTVFFAGAAGCIYLAYLLLTVKAGNLPEREAWCRKKIPGVLLGYVVLITCVPYAKVVSPDFLIPLLWPLALILPPLCAKFADNITSRAVGGALILLAYLTVHAGFERKLPLAEVLSVLSWLIGIGGIWISAQPWKLRDLFRSGKTLRSWCAAFLIIYALLLSGEMIWHLI